jgi:hypothetical protein
MPRLVMKSIPNNRWLCVPLFVLPLCVLASWPFPQKTIEATPEVAKKSGIEVQFLAAPSQNHVQVVVHCPEKSTNSKAFHSMTFRLMEKGAMIVSASMDPAVKNGVVTGSFYVQKTRAEDCIVALWYGQPFKDIVEYKIALSQYRHNEGGAANRSQPVGSETNRTSVAAGSSR